MSYVSTTGRGLQVCGVWSHHPAGNDTETRTDVQQVFEIALPLGSAVAKAACKLWLKDVPLAGDTSARMIDIIESKVSGTRERRRVAAIFNGIEERVTEAILANMAHEYRSLRENERIAAIDAATRSIDRASLSASDLFENDLDPIYLRSQIRNQDPAATRDLGEAATQLYEKTIQQCSILIIASASLLPGYEVGAFAALLQRHSETLLRLDSIAGILQSAESTNADDLFASTYRQLVVSQLDRVTLFGFTVSDRLRRYPLRPSYVTLSAVSNIPISPRAWLDYSLAASHERVQESSIPIDLALSLSPRLLVRGEAGSGKTTLLQWVAVQAASGSFSGVLRDWKNVTPFFLRLRHYVGKTLPAPENFVTDIGRHIADEMPRGWVHARLRSGDALVLVDGVDELPSSERQSARDWLESLAREFPKARYIVTSRPAAASAEWLERLDFGSIAIQPMSLADARELIRLWHAALRQSSLDGDEIAGIDEAENNLCDALVTRRHLRQLVTNPLLAAMLCALHLDRRMQLPTDKLELYAIAIEALIQRRDIERRITGANVDLSRSAKMVLLEDLAYWMIRNGLSSAPRDRVLERIRQRIASMPKVDCTAGEVLRALLDRSGLLREPIPDTFDFVHRSFQEYLAARAAVDADDIETLLAHVRDDQWAETVMMACGSGHERQREDLVRGILGAAVSAGRDAPRIKALAVGCLEMSPNLSPGLQKEVFKIAKQLLPPRNMSNVVNLALTGDLALELLPAGPSPTARSRAATIRLASLVGGDLALRVIAQNAGSAESAVIAELDQAWGRFDPVTYAQTVLANVPGKQLVLRVDDPAKVPGLAYTRCRTLRCTFRAGHGDFSFIQDMHSLVSLQVFEDRFLCDLRPIARNQKLQHLYLEKTGPISLSQLEGATNITDLEVDAESSDIDLRELVSLSHLKQVQIVNECDADEVLGALSDIARLRRFGLWRASAVEDLRAFLETEPLELLDFLLLGRADKLESIDGISRWAETCTGLYLHAPRLTNLSELSQMPHLDFLNLALCAITDISFVGALPELRILHIGGTMSVPDLSPLRDAHSLKSLFIYGEGPVDVSPLRALDRLSGIHIGGRRKGDIIGREKLHRGVKIITR